MYFREKIVNLLIIMALLIPLLVTAQETPATTDAASPPTAPAAPVFPCETDPAFSDFDFWVGEWNVHLADGRAAGANRIISEQRGCVLVEHWESVSGGTGTSINYVDKVSGEWVQIWNDASGSQINIRGNLTDAGMLLVGTIHYVANGTTFAFRGLWTPLDDGRVRQFFEQSPDDGETWTSWFEGFYSRKDD